MWNSSKSINRHSVRKGFQCLIECSKLHQFKPTALNLLIGLSVEMYFYHVKFMSLMHLSLLLLLLI